MKTDVDIGSCCGQTALIIASESNNDKLVSLLLDKGCDFNAVDNQTALKIAVDKGHDTIMLLLANGASMEIGCEKTPLLVTTIETNQFSSFCCLIDFGSDVNVKYGSESLTYLMTTENVYGFSLQFIIHLVTTGARVSSPRSRLAVHECIACGDSDALSGLLHSGSFSPVLLFSLTKLMKLWLVKFKVLFMRFVPPISWPCFLAKTLLLAICGNIAF